VGGKERKGEGGEWGRGRGRVDLDNSALLSEKEGFSVVAPMRVTSPDSTDGRNTSWECTENEGALRDGVQRDEGRQGRI
jgi:hypothetical protein